MLGGDFGLVLLNLADFRRGLEAGVGTKNLNQYRYGNIM
jgi:hypothetical protein